MLFVQEPLHLDIPFVASTEVSHCSHLQTEGTSHNFGPGTEQARAIAARRKRVMRKEHLAAVAQLSRSGKASSKERRRYAGDALPSAFWSECKD